MPIPGVGFTQDSLKEKKIALAIMAVQISGTYVIMECDRITANLLHEPPSNANKTPTYMSGPQDYQMKVGLLASELTAGSYIIDGITCDKLDGQRRIVSNYHAAPGQPYASFSVEAGEVVDLGMLTLDTLVLRGTGEPTVSSVVFVDAIPDAAVQKVRPDIAAKLTKRHMNSGLPLSQGAIENRCTLQRNLKSTPLVVSGTPSEPPVCRRLSSFGMVASGARH